MGISIGGTEHELSVEEIELVMEPLPGYEVEAESGHAVALSVELDAELISEGFAREIVRAVQNARKGAGFEVTDRIVLDLSGDDELIEAAQQHLDHIAAETLAETIGWDPSGEVEEVSIDGRELSLAVRRSS